MEPSAPRRPSTRSAMVRLAIAMPVFVVALALASQSVYGVILVVLLVPASFLIERHLNRRGAAAGD